MENKIYLGPEFVEIFSFCYFISEILTGIDCEIYCYIHLLLENGSLMSSVAREMRVLTQALYVACYM